MDAIRLQGVDVSELVPEMLKTIRIPQNLKLLSSSLPKANYEPLKLSNLDKNSFLDQYNTVQHKKRQISSMINMKPSGMSRRQPKQKFSDRVDDNLYENSQLLRRVSPIKQQVANDPVVSGQLDTPSKPSNLPQIAKKNPADPLKLNLKYLGRKRVEYLYEQEMNKLSHEPAVDESPPKNSEVTDVVRHSDKHAAR